MTLHEENWARGRTWRDGLADDPNCEDVDPAIRTPAQEVLVPLAALKRIAASAETPVDVRAKIDVLLQEKLYHVRPLSNDEHEDVNRSRKGDDKLELSAEFRPIDDELLDEIYELARASTSMGGTPGRNLREIPWWRQYEVQVARLVRDRFEECRRHIASVEADYWERLKRHRQMEDERKAFVELHAPPGAKHQDYFELEELEEQWESEHGPCVAPNLLEHPLTVAGAWTLLAAVYDLCAAEAGTMALIKPERRPSHDEEEHERLTGFHFEILKNGIRDQERSYRLLIEEALGIVTVEAGQSGDEPKNGKRSTSPGEARVKIVSGLIEHHNFEKGGCGNLVPIGVRPLARKIEVSESTVSGFFKVQFTSHARYKSICRNEQGLLVASLKMLNGEYPAHILFGGVPPSEQEREDE